MAVKGLSYKSSISFNSGTISWIRLLKAVENCDVNVTYTTPTFRKPKVVKMPDKKQNKLPHTATSVLRNHKCVVNVSTAFIE